MEFALGAAKPAPSALISGLWTTRERRTGGLGPAGDGACLLAQPLAPVPSGLRLPQLSAPE